MRINRNSIVRTAKIGVRFPVEAPRTYRLWRPHTKGTRGSFSRVKQPEREDRD
jgi:hypothetical protein